MDTQTPEHEVIDRLRELAEASRHEEPSPEVGARLMRAFSDVQAAPPSRPVYWPLAVAAAVVLIALSPLLMQRTTDRRSAPATPDATSAQSAPGPLDGFVPVPGAASLPRLESASIVRYQVPVTALPAYGVEVVPAAPGRAVEADLLIGQDGHTRAIRLVSDLPTTRSQP